ncbi:MAG TPA: peptide deformylase [Fibrobacteres bacterium]|nr:peptide deformylase [Fibrobacterota bacterium]
MTARPVLVYGNSVLRKRAKPVTSVSPALKRLADEMLESMYASNGIGLAAPQIGESVRLIVVDVGGEEKRDPRVFFNPEIVSSSGEAVAEEGCLSVPDVWADVTRPETITLKALDYDGKPVELKNLDGLLARCIQHEIDHLEGVLFVDKISATDRLMNEPKLKKMARGAR